MRGLEGKDRVCGWQSVSQVSQVQLDRLCATR